MKGFTAIMASAGMLALAACGQKADEKNVAAATVNDSAATANNAAATPAPLSGGQAFANTAAASDAFEIASSKLALDKAKSPAVKTFAEHMIAAHTDSTAKLKAAAAGATPAITPDPTPTAEQQQSLDALGGLAGADFDTAYVAAQTDGHTKTLAALKDYSANGDVPQLKDFATMLVPTVTAHLNMAKGLKP